MSHITVHQHIHTPLAQAFEHFLNFEQYPEFMHSVRSVQWGEDPATIRFTYHRAGYEHQHTVAVTIDHDARTVTWRSVAGPEHAGTATFRADNPQACTMTVDITAHPRVAGATSTALGFVRNRIEHDLHRFATHVEEQTGSRPPADAPDHRAPSERLFDALFPTDQRRNHP